MADLSRTGRRKYVPTNGGLLVSDDINGLVIAHNHVPFSIPAPISGCGFGE